MHMLQEWEGVNFLHFFLFICLFIGKMFIYRLTEENKSNKFIPIPIQHFLKNYYRITPHIRPGPYKG